MIAGLILKFFKHEHEVFNTTIEGHDEVVIMGDEDDDGSTPEETESASKVLKVSPEEAIIG